MYSSFAFEQTRKTITPDTIAGYYFLHAHTNHKNIRRFFMRRNPRFTRYAPPTPPRLSVGCRSQAARLQAFTYADRTEALDSFGCPGTCVHQCLPGSGYIDSTMLGQPEHPPQTLLFSSCQQKGLEISWVWY